jgi:signal transduction histidine kinase
VSEVRLTLVATDRNDRHLPNLSPADIVVLEDGQPIPHFELRPAGDEVGRAKSRDVPRTLADHPRRESIPRRPGDLEEKWRVLHRRENHNPCAHPEGEVTHFISNDKDITEQRRLESVPYQAQKMDAIGQLAGGVAHDFNNLLMVISSYAELMRDSIGPEHPLHRNVQEILKASRRAAD